MAKVDVSTLSNIELLNALENKIVETVLCKDYTYRNKRMDIANLKREIDRRMNK